MEIVFRCLEGGRKLYTVVSQGRELFVGTRHECDRYLAIHERKVLEEREGDLRPTRHRPFLARTYRVSGKLHA